MRFDYICSSLTSLKDTNQVNVEKDDPKKDNKKALIRNK